MRILAAIAIAVVAVGATVLAHDIPNDVTVQAFLRPDGRRLRFVVRVPLSAIRDVQIPRRGPGDLDLARAESARRHGATIWTVEEAFLAKRSLGEGAVWDIASSRDPAQTHVFLADGRNMKIDVLKRGTLEELTSVGDGGRRRSSIVACARCPRRRGASSGRAGNG